MAQHFAAPDGYMGHFGWLCGYSGDAPFLDDATGRFTGLTGSQRAYQGRIAIAMMLDPGNPPIAMPDVPGVAHLPIKNIQKKPFRLMHAKVALLGFRNQENPSRWQLRLLVSTGNWTRQTLEESLDLVWRIDITTEAISNPDAKTRQDCADIHAAWNLLAWIQQHYDSRLLNAAVNGQGSESMNAQNRVRHWIEACSQNAKGQPRIFDNRKKSLLAQLPEKIRAYGEKKRNYLAMGAGFYETSANNGNAPEVPLAILESLYNGGLLTKQRTVDLYVNPLACQGIATALKSLESCGITIRPAVTPALVYGASAQRTLHAKFLFSANIRGNSNNCASAWVYLGSGNLTHPGFARAMSSSAGNLEAGVVLAPDSLYWEKTNTNQEHNVVTNLLPIQRDNVIGGTLPMSAGPAKESRDAKYVEPPVAWLTWHEGREGHELRTDETDAIDIEVLVVLII